MSRELELELKIAKLQAVNEKLRRENAEMRHTVKDARRRANEAVVAARNARNHALRSCPYNCAHCSQIQLNSHFQWRKV